MLLWGGDTEGKQTVGAGAGEGHPGGGQPPWGADIQAGFCTVVTERTFQAETLQRARVLCLKGSERWLQVAGVDRWGQITSSPDKGFYSK